MLGFLPIAALVASDDLTGELQNGLQGWDHLGFRAMGFSAIDTGPSEGWRSEKSSLKTIHLHRLIASMVKYPA